MIVRESGPADERRRDRRSQENPGGGTVETVAGSGPRSERFGDDARVTGRFTCVGKRSVQGASPRVSSMLSRENRVSLAFALTALVVGLAVDLLTELPEWVALGAVLVVGLVAPRLYVRFVGIR